MFDPGSGVLFVVILESFFRMGHMLDKPAVRPTSESAIIFENHYIRLNTHRPVQAGMGERFASTPVHHRWCYRTTALRLVEWKLVSVRRDRPPTPEEEEK